MIVTEDGVRQALFMMHSEKVHGPGGMTTFFSSTIGLLLRGPT